VHDAVLEAALVCELEVPAEAGGERGVAAAHDDRG
jgi:hypothetical protein